MRRTHRLRQQLIRWSLRRQFLSNHMFQCGAGNCEWRRVAYHGCTGAASLKFASPST